MDDDEANEAFKNQVVARYGEEAGDPMRVGVLVAQAGIEIALAPFRARASESEKKLIRTHYPDATEETIGAYRLNRDGVLLMLEVTSTLARQYLDHQPETSAHLDAVRNEVDLKDIRSFIHRNLASSFANAASIGGSSYDVTAAVIVNTVDLALKNGVAFEQVVNILLESIQRIVGILAGRSDDDDGEERAR